MGTEEAVGAGRTIEDAMEAAASRLGLRPGEGIAEVLQEPGRGWLGLGTREARVRLRRPTKGEAAATFLRGLASAVGTQVEVEVHAASEGTTTWDIGVLTEDAGRWIGRGGQTLEALRTIADVVAVRVSGSRDRLNVDVGGYRGRRERELRDAARRAADRARRLGREVMMDPMPANERRLVHLAAREVEGIETRSVGEEPLRRVVIAPSHRVE
jgi:spoIIIJ-associated protein